MTFAAVSIVVCRIFLPFYRCLRNFVGITVQLNHNAFRKSLYNLFQRCSVFNSFYSFRMNYLIRFDFIEVRRNNASALRLLVTVLITIFRHLNLPIGIISYLSARRCISHFAFKTEYNGFALIRLQTEVSRWSVNERYPTVRNLSY